MALKIDATQKKAIQQEFIEAIKAEGLVLLPKPIAQLSQDIYQKQTLLLEQPYITPYQIAKNALLPGVKTLKTVKDMIADNRLELDEYFTDSNGKLQIFTTAIKRLADAS